MLVSHALRQRLAGIFRRFPALIRIPYYGYRLIQPKYSLGVTGVVFNANKHVLLVEHVFHPRLPWGLPGGWINNNEDPAAAIARELREELELNVTVKTLIRAQKTEYNHLDMAFLCEAHNEIGTISYELLGYRWVDPATLPPLHRFHYEAIIQAVMMLEETHVPTH